MRRREFIAELGSAPAWPLAARAQQSEKLTIGVLMGWDENDREARAYVAGLTQGLLELGWTVGRNIRMEVRWEASSIDRKRILAKELVALQPDVILSGNTPETDALRRETMTIPIVFTTVSDPVAPASSPVCLVLAGTLLDLCARRHRSISPRRLLCGSHFARRQAGDLPVQLPVKFLMGVNVKSAKALGLTVPPNLLAIADEVIE